MRDALPKFFKRFQITSAVFLTKREVDNGYDLIKMETFLQTWGGRGGRNYEFVTRVYLHDALENSFSQSFHP